MAHPPRSLLLASAALHNGGKIALLPEGEARVEQVAEVDVEAASKKKHVALYSITGLDFSPTYIWLEKQGNDKSKGEEKFFAVVDDWGSVLPEGWESALKQLLAAQDQVKQSRSDKLAAKLAHHPSNNRIFFKHANLFDSESGKIIPNRYVLVEGNRSVTRRKRRGLRRPRFPKIIDARGKTLLPGLWDMHAHVGDNDGLLNLAAGVTTVRDLANDTDSLLARRQRIADGKEIGTRIVIAGIIDGRRAIPGSDQGSRLHRSRSPRRRRQLQETRLRADQDLQLRSARRSFPPSSTKPTRTASASADTSPPV